MKRQVVLLLLASLVTLSGCATLSAMPDNAVVRAKDKVFPALVHIRPVKEVYTGGTKEEMVVVGSGFLISSDGYVVTNEHVAGESKLVRCVLSDKEELEADVVGTDRYTDIALLKLRTDRKDLPFVRMGRSSTLKAGQTVLALGSPLGLARSVSMGIVSVTDRYLGDPGDTMFIYNTWIQTDAAINHGNSGGPLVNLAGEVVGVNSRRLGAAENVGFAIPVDTVREVVDALKSKGRMERSWIGVNLQAMIDKTDDPKLQGVLIGDVDPVSPANEAGITPGDVLLAIDGAPTNARFIEEIPAINKLIADLPLGKEVSLRVLRGDAEQEIKLKVGDRGDLKGEEVEFPSWGFTASEVTAAIMRRAQLPSQQGVYVIGVQVGGVASTAQLSEGDIILRIDKEDIPNMATFKTMYEARGASKQPLILLTVKRGALSRFVLLKPNPEETPEAQPTPTQPAPAQPKGDGHVE